MKKRLLPILTAVLMVFAMAPLAGQSVVNAEESLADPEIATWAGFRKAAASFTFEDGAPSHVNDAAPLFKKYGYKASFYLVCNWNPNWNGFQELANNGHEIGSHSNSHGQNMSGEEASSKKNINNKISQKYGCITVAYPNGNVPNESAVLQNYIAGRTYENSSANTMGKDGPSNWAKVPALTTGNQGTINSTSGFTSKMQTVISSGGWVVFATWGFRGKTNGNATYSPTDLNAIDGALKWAKQNDSDIWVAPLRDVAMYIKERNASMIARTASSSSRMTYTLKHTIADTISNYDYPLSVRVPLPADWLTAKVTQDGASLESRIDDGWMYFDAVPNGGDIVVRRTDSNIDDEVHNHDGVTFEPWDGKASLPSDSEDAKGYYLTEDVTISSEWKVDKHIMLCLNGHSITITKDGSSAIVNADGILDLYNCGTTGTITHAAGVTGPGILINDRGTFHMYGGSISGNHATASTFYGGGVLIFGGGTFNMEGGTICDNSAEYGGGIYIDNNGVFNMEGGSITRNSATDGGGGVLGCISSLIQFSGTPVITGNTLNGAPNNIMGVQAIMIAGTLNTPEDTTGPQIGVTMESPGVFTSGLSLGLPADKKADDLFFSDDPAYKVTETDALEAQLTRAVGMDGYGTKDSPYEITSYEDLNEFAAIVNGTHKTAAQNTGACGKLKNAITCNDKKWVPIGSENNPYTGHFDGNGKTISGLSNADVDDVSDLDFQGLFGYSKGRVENVGIESGNIKGKYAVGGVVGYNLSTITNCYYTGAVSGTSSVGGVSGDNNGETANCYNAGAVSGEKQIGGVVGFSRNKMTNCYNTGTVSGEKQIGGVVGYFETDSVTNCYNVGAVRGATNVGGVAGFNWGGSAANCYYDKTLCLASTALGGRDDTDTVKGLTTSQMTGTDALSDANMRFTCDEPEKNPWLVKANAVEENGTYYWYYPHLKGFDLDSDGKQISDTAKIAAEDWPAKVLVDAAVSDSFTYSGTAVQPINKITVSAESVAVPGSATEVKYRKAGDTDWTTDKPTAPGSYELSYLIDDNETTIPFAILDPEKDYNVSYYVKTGENPGTWSIVGEEGAVNAGDYKAVISFTNSGPDLEKEFEITPVELTIIVSGSSIEKTYSGEEQTYQGTVTAKSSDAAFDALKFNYTGSTVVKGTKVGDHTTDLLTENCSYTDGNYNANFEIGDPITLTVIKADITPAVSIEGWNYGSAENKPSVSDNPDGTEAGDGDVTFWYKGKDDPDNKYVKDAVPTEAGSYTVKAEVAATDNYNAATATTDFTISPIDMQVTSSGFNGAYDGAEHSITVNAPEGAAVEYSANGGTVWSEENPAFMETGSNTIDFKVTLKNYNEYTGQETVNITQAENSATASLEGWTYGKKENTPTVTADFGAETAVFTYSDAPDGTFTQDVPKKAGTWYVKATIPETANYAGAESLPEAFEIAKASITILADNKSSKYGETLKDLTYQVSGAYVTSDDLGIKLSTAAKKDKPGTYAIMVAWNNNPNYKATLTDGKYTVGEKPTKKTTKPAAKIRIDAGLKGTSSGGTVTACWGKVDGASSYVVYATYCGKNNKYKKVMTVSGSTRQAAIKKMNGKQLNQKKNVKYYVIAYKNVNGQKIKLAKSLVIHVVGSQNKKFSNVKAIKVKKRIYTLKKGETKKIKAKLTYEKKHKKRLTHVRSFRYATTNAKVAKVSKKGVITAVGKGRCTIYIYAHNGLAKKVTVKVK